MKAYGQSQLGVDPSSASSPFTDATGSYGVQHALPRMVSLSCLGISSRTQSTLLLELHIAAIRRISCVSARAYRARRASARAAEQMVRELRFLWDYMARHVRELQQRPRFVSEKHLARNLISKLGTLRRISVDRSPWRDLSALSAELWVLLVALSTGAILAIRLPERRLALHWHYADRTAKRRCIYLIDLIGARGRIRTHDPQIRSLVLYPTELPARSAPRMLRRGAEHRRGPEARRRGSPYYTLMTPSASRTMRSSSSRDEAPLAGQSVDHPAAPRGLSLLDEISSEAGRRRP